VVEVTRGEVVEARHTVHAVAVRDGRVELAAGEPALVAYLRSSAKPLQALPVVRARPELDDAQVALLCASHRATPEQLAVVRRILTDAPASEADLECGHEPTPIEHNCSGKHAGFIALCRTEDWTVQGYRLLDHPCQQAMLREVAAAAEVDAETLPIGVDGCGVPTFALPLERAAHAFARLPSLEDGDRVVRAMRAEPELLRGPVAADVLLIRALDGWVAKGGAEGLFCAASNDGLGVALKVVDGAFRAIAPALEHLLAMLDIAAPGVHDPVLRNSRGDPIGALRAVPSEHPGHGRK
jgi:L-asparaginase II